MTEIKLTKEAIQRAAEKCPTAEGVLKELAPECFEVQLQKGLIYKNEGSYGGAYLHLGDGRLFLIDTKQGYEESAYGFIVGGKECNASLGKKLADSVEEYFKKKFAGEL